MSKIKTLLPYSVSLLFLILLDQLSKYLIRQEGGFYLCNSGIAWGIKLPSFFFWIFWTIIISFVLYLIYQEGLKKNIPCNLFMIALVLVLSGAIGNLIDRIFFGCIIDFINLKIWPVFNLADTFITLGAIIIFIKHTTNNIRHTTH